jgi:hypothetical protein
MCAANNSKVSDLTLRGLFREVLSQIKQIIEWNIDREVHTFTKNDVKLRLAA